jgi:hypothetical protein
MGKYIIWFCALCVLTSCGVSYKPLTLGTLAFQNTAPVTDKVSVAYQYDIQLLSKNKRYSKKERKAGYAAVGVRIKNDSDQPIQLSKNNLKVAIGAYELQPLETEAYTAKVKQHPASHLLHALWGPWAFTHIEYGTESENHFKYYPVGAAVGLINLLIASMGNINHEAALKTNSIFGKTVAPGQSVDGVILLQASGGYQPLTFTLKE